MISSSSHFNTLPQEIVLRILSHLSPIDLAKVGKVNQRLAELSIDDTLWKELSRRRWANKKHIVFSLHPRVDYTDLIPSLTIREMKGILKARGVAVEDLLEKLDLIATLIRTTPIGPGTVKLQEGKWKSSFICAEIDAERISITLHEITTLDWIFKFTNAPHNVVGKAKFRSDYTYTSDFFNTIMQWKFVGNGMIQVEEYPVLRCTRTPQWGWRLSNNYAIIESV